MNISERALLASLTISSWTARKYDKKQTQAVAANNGVRMDVGRYNKALLPVGDKLKAVTCKVQHIRAKYYANTLPWGLDGTRMLPSANYLPFMQDFRSEKAEYEVLVKDFVSDYPYMKHAAQNYLGPLYNDADYPTVQQIEKKFGMDMAIMPVPTNDFRVNIGEKEMARIQQDVEARVNQAAQAAMQDVWQRLYDRLSHLADKVSNPDSRLHNSTVDGLMELCSLLTRLNFADDPNLEEMRQEVEAKVLCHSADNLRNDETVRRTVRNDLDDVMLRMGAFMGGAN